ncbi:hypothetical protein HDE_06669 [Halotydeus destructor]|nr:hypothetical protein HDE_06669 [Halotydeus destructor]
MWSTYCTFLLATAVVVENQVTGPNSKMYVFGHGTKLTFDEAQIFCKQNDGQLVEFENVIELARVSSLVRFNNETNYWIGATSVGDYKNVTWLSSGLPLNASSQYISLNLRSDSCLEDCCLNVASGMKIRASQCTIKALPMCQLSRDTVVNTTSATVATTTTSITTSTTMATTTTTTTMATTTPCERVNLVFAPFINVTVPRNDDPTINQIHAKSRKVDMPQVASLSFRKDIRMPRARITIVRQGPTNTKWLTTLTVMVVLLTLLLSAIAFNMYGYRKKRYSIGSVRFTNEL